MPGEVSRAAAHHTLHKAHPRCDQAHIRQRTNAHRRIDVVVDEVHIAVAERQLHIDFGKGGKKVIDDRQNMQSTEDDGRSHDKIAPWRDVLA